MRVITWVVFVVQARIYFQAIQGLCSGPVLIQWDCARPVSQLGRTYSPASLEHQLRYLAL